MFSVKFCLVIVAFFCAVNEIAADQYKIIETINGQVRGVQKKTLLKGIPFYSFKGIPYAKPPVGDLRLKAPEPIDSWKPKVLDAFEHSKICVQPGKLFPEPFEQNEDCLTLNIYIPADVKGDEKLSVLFFIHGGGYAEGSSNDDFYGPDFIVEKQTILVTANYRLGLLGFLSLDTPEYSGNMGLKDQQLALKWISLNIDRFGGDQKRVTIFGESAGGASVHFHMLSTESRKYFRNAIPMSGVVDNCWATSKNNDHLELAYKIANDLDKPKKTYKELVAFLRSAPADKLSEYSLINVPNVLFEIPFAPVIERKDAKQPFIVESPTEIYEKSQADVDALFTMTSLELVGYTSLFPSLKEVYSNYNLPLPMKELDLDSEKTRKLTSEIWRFYFNDNVESDQATKQYVELLSDLNFGCGIDKAVRTHASKSNGKTFYLWFSLYSKLSTFAPRSPEVANAYGASHGDELFYLFRCHFAQSLYDEVLKNQNSKESKISLQAIDNISTIFANFAKYGTPTHQNEPIEGLLPAKQGKVYFVDVNNNGLTVGRRPNKIAFDFWANIEERAIQLSNDLKKQERNEL